MSNSFNPIQFALANNITGKALTVLSNNLQRVITPIKANLMDYVNKNICSYFNITGHYDSYISKSCVSILEGKYLSKKYGTTLIDVDPSFALCSASIERVKKKIVCFPEYVNKTIAPGIYSLVMDKEGTRMIVVKEPVLSKDDRSDNGILSIVVHYSTSVFFIGPNRVKWYEKVRREIDDLVSAISKTNQDNNRIRYNSLSSHGEESKDLQVRPMNLLSFPAKESLLKEINDFRRKEKIYNEYSVPYRKGFLLSGKPGTGKTAFAFSLAQYLEMDCISVNLDVFDKQNGDNAFNMPNTIYVIDEIDSQIVNRQTSTHEEVQNQNTTSRRLLHLLKAMDTMGHGSIVVATTNYPERLDPALRRSGRFDVWCEMDDLSEEFASEMVRNRGCDPEKILKGKTFPINPAELEQDIIRSILVDNKIGNQNEIASFEDLDLREDNEEYTTEELSENNETEIDDSLNDETDEEVIIPITIKDSDEQDELNTLYQISTFIDDEDDKDPEEPNLDNLSGSFKNFDIDDLED